ncbi:MAG: anti-anti-sigma regulatory factor [Herminiimonas sp.]|nr:anti-anti-sigma regulatory factor [Herminiimonas sp.]MDB5853528.1 anti-anti-sigma regulatory factor [Herminiimonas sp.]
MYRPTLTLTLPNARGALEAGLAAIASGQTQFDMEQLNVVDSSAVATLVAWKRAAREKGAELRFINLPADLLSLAGLYGVTELIEH